MDKMREEFEAWVDANEIFHDLYEEEFELMWAAWQASRQAMVVELPNPDFAEQDDYRELVIEAMDNAGVKCK